MIRETFYEDITLAANIKASPSPGDTFSMDGKRRLTDEWNAKSVRRLNVSPGGAVGHFSCSLLSGSRSAWVCAKIGQNRWDDGTGDSVGPEDLLDGRTKTRLVHIF